ncbi:SusC/RagA family TonB-linked outer membrane protein [Sphingobacterium sp. SGL-16]|uniref:SusC/RagA family TonB-linked outer membrane protein n=1 Tax=Sphingobacterium sp. SGL-16 TaxID=2710883 RepID=UPI0013EA632A|nr:SusC/RagA family TonB-linked outer membrane protein [Sphingobacterium sp. SGL-16]NGM72829.1 SusC/RagA family TonB-linked outer membrane protein [Sphingobacterium sp. SGL-16]
MKINFIFLLLLLSISVKGQITGVVYNEQNELIPGVTVTLKKANRVTITNHIGAFNFKDIPSGDTLLFEHVGYQKLQLFKGLDIGPLEIILLRNDRMIQEVEIINTGFYQIPKERATGAFEVIDNKLLNRAIGGNILQRMEGVISGVQFVNAGGKNASDIRVRGLATILSDSSPLIVIDNFPYEGDINSINPNDIENISILKDAAAASIWGARAGNGVIVITTKQGGYKQKGKLSFNNNYTVGMKPDLLYSRNRLPSDVVMQIEKNKYDLASFYRDDTRQFAFPLYVEMLIDLNKGTISKDEFDIKESELRNTEVREEAMNYLYQESLYKQYAINAMGGGDSFTYFISAGYDRNRMDVIGNNNTRLNLNMQNTYMPAKGFEIRSSIWYSEQSNLNNGVNIDDIKGHTTHVGLSPYTKLADINGNALSIIKDLRYPYVSNAQNNGLLDWDYRPLEDRNLVKKTGRMKEMRVNLGINYQFLNYFTFNGSYQYIKGDGTNSVQYDKDSFYVRDLVNRYTQTNGTQVIPYGGIDMLLNPNESNTHSARMQLNYNQNFGQHHQVVGLIGGEKREFVQESLPGYTLYNYDPDLLTGTNLFSYTEFYPTRPSGGRLRIPQPDYVKRKFTDRYLSYFGNSSYTFKRRYVASASIRWDGSNLFGVKTNQKGTPLWSIGGSWNLGMEDWFNVYSLNHLRLKATYGSAGNVNKSVSAYPTIRHLGIDEFKNMNYSIVNSIGNPSLQWEKVNTVNFGLESKWFQNRLSLELDYYIKNANDLIGAEILPPSTGIYIGSSAERSNLVNYADLQTKGIDAQLSTKNLTGDFVWNTVLLLNFAKNEVKAYKANNLLKAFEYLDGKTPVVGQSRDMLFSLPWFGLNPENGDPVIYQNGEISQDYTNYYNNLKFSDLVASGMKVPPFYGSLRNEFSWRGLSISALFTFKSNYVFRRKSLDPSSVNTSHLNYHMDYFNRWQKKGDELWTNVPSQSTVYNAGRAQTYLSSEALITKGDHIRFQDINISYSLHKDIVQRLRLQQIQFYAYARNLGIVWKSNSNAIDPDYADSEYVAPKSFALGIRVDF